MSREHINNGGPAFPRPASEFTKHGTLRDGNDAVPEQEGMSLRDYFAAKALAGLLADPNVQPSRTSSMDNWVQTVAERAFQFADAMLKARQSGGAA